MSVDLEQELITDLSLELSATDENFKTSILLSKIKNAIRDVKKARNYPSYYTEEQIEADMYGHYSNIRALALFDYNMVGAEGQTSSSELNTSRNFVDRNTYFSGVLPLSKS